MGELDVGALIVRIGFWGYIILYYNKQPPKQHRYLLKAPTLRRWAYLGQALMACTPTHQPKLATSAKANIPTSNTPKALKGRNSHAFWHTDSPGKWMVTFVHDLFQSCPGWAQAARI